MMGSCETCGNSGVQCPGCSLWSRWVAGHTEFKYDINRVSNAELREEGYDMCLDGIKEWWNHMNGETIGVPKGSTPGYALIYVLLEHLKDKQKRRFHPHSGLEGLELDKPDLSLFTTSELFDELQGRSSTELGLSKFTAMQLMEELWGRIDK